MCTNYYDVVPAKTQTPKSPLPKSPPPSHLSEHTPDHCDPTVEFDALQGLSKTVGSHLRCRDVAETHSAVVGLLAYVVILDIDVLRTGGDIQGWQ